MKAPFAFRNGKLNLIEAIQFEGQTPSSVFSRASVRAVEGQFLSEYHDPKFGEVGLVVVGKFSADQGEDRRTAENVFEKHGVPMYAFERLDRFARTRICKLYWLGSCRRKVATFPYGLRAMSSEMEMPRSFQRPCAAIIAR